MPRKWTAAPSNWIIWRSGNRRTRGQITAAPVAHVRAHHRLECGVLDVDVVVKEQRERRREVVQAEVARRGQPTVDLERMDPHGRKARLDAGRAAVGRCVIDHDHLGQQYPCPSRSERAGPARPRCSLRSPRRPQEAPAARGRRRALLRVKDRWSLPCRWLEKVAARFARALVARRALGPRVTFPAIPPRVNRRLGAMRCRAARLDERVVRALEDERRAVRPRGPCPILRRGRWRRWWRQTRWRWWDCAAVIWARSGQ